MGVVLSVIWGFLRVKNEQRWLGRVLESMLPACDRILLFNDHSKDETAAIARSFEKVCVFDSPFEGVEEVRDKNFLLDRLEESAEPGDMVLAIDGDEEIAGGGCNVIRETAAKPEGADSYQFRVLYLWNSESQVRVDGVYRNFHRPSLFRFRRGVRFHSGTACGFHCGNVPQPRSTERLDVKLLHYGYMHKADRLRKWEFYNKLDPENVSEGYDWRHPKRGSYPHIVQGDIPEVPATAILAHGGPLELRAL